MSKLLVLAGLTALLVIPASAQAAATTKLHGVVVAKESSRHVLVVASPRGALTSVRVTARQLRATRLGTRLALAGAKLPDGSLRATRLHRLGRAKVARVRATVLKVGAAKILVAGGGTAFVIRLTHATRVLAAARTGLEPGDEIDSEVALGKDGAVGTSVQTDGQSVLIDFSGSITALDSTSITVSSDGISTVVAIPDGVTLPSLVQVGSEVEIVASISGTTWTLVEVKIDSEGDGGGGSSVGGDATVEVQGVVTALDTSSLTVQPGDNASPVTLAIPAGFTLPDGLAAGSSVEAKGDVVGGVLTLTKIDLQDSGDNGDQTTVEAEGTVTALDSTSITIQSSDSGPAVTFAIPDGFTLPDGLQAGSSVDAKGSSVSGTLTLSEIELQDSGSGDNGGDGGSSGGGSGGDGGGSGSDG